MSLLLALLAVTLPAGQDWFYPGTGDAIALIDDDPGHGDRGATVGGLHVERTGYLLARVADSQALGTLRALPEVAGVEVLRGDGRVVRVRPRDGMSEIALSRRLHDRDGVIWSHPDFALP